MKKSEKVVGILLLVVVLGAAGLVGGVEIVRHRTERQVVAMIAKLPPGTPLPEVVKLLGEPVQTFTGSEEIGAWVERLGSRVEPEIAAASVLHAFVHRGPPFRYILIYTDRESKKVVHADWCHM